MAQASGVLVTLPTYNAPELVDEIVIGPLTTPFELVGETGVVRILSNRFPVPPTAAGFVTDVLDETRATSGVTGTITSALSPGGQYLEPTIGQIWPR